MVNRLIFILIFIIMSCKGNGPAKNRKDIACESIPMNILAWHVLFTTSPVTIDALNSNDPEIIDKQVKSIEVSDNLMILSEIDNCSYGADNDSLLIRYYRGYVDGKK